MFEIIFMKYLKLFVSIIILLCFQTFIKSKVVNASVYSDDQNLRVDVNQNSLDIQTKSNKNNDLSFTVESGAKKYYLVPDHVLNKTLKKQNLVKTGIYVVDDNSKSFLKNSVTYKKVTSKNKTHYYLASLHIPLHSLDKNFNESAILKVSSNTKNWNNHNVTVVGLTTGTIFTVILIILWGYLLTILKRAKIHGLFFWVGSIGTFVIIAYFFHNQLSEIMAICITYIVKFFGDITGLFTVIPEKCQIYLGKPWDLVQLNINYECSGMLEILVFESLLLFYPIYSFNEKIYRSLEGILWISGANIIRILLVILGIIIWGSQSIFWIHSIFSRLIFYVLLIALYYNVFTKKQIIKGWKG